MGDRTAGGVPVRVAELMAESGVAFGTSGARGRVEDMTDRVCYAYTAAFLKHLEGRGEAKPGGRVGLGGDLRPSTSRILRAVSAAARGRGYQPVHCGSLPSPALALFGLREGIPTVMVTGSHIPADRNGIKFTRVAGEITKADEAGIRGQEVRLPEGAFDASGALRRESEAALPGEVPDAAEAYVARYLDGFPGGCLRELRIALYEHSAVGRDLLYRILTGLGARVERLARSEAFVPVDTEAIRPEDAERARRWAEGGRFDAVVSTDGDGDRPLVSDERGVWLRGDVAGILTARLLGADAVAVPVSCNTAVERSGWFRRVIRTRIGSPYVIEGMEGALAAGFRAVVGYEANGGFLTACALSAGGGELAALPTRDAAVVILSLLLGVARERRPLSRLLADLPPRFTASGRVPDFPVEISRRKVEELGASAAACSAALGTGFRRVAAVDTIDGVRATLEDGSVVHLRASGNAPEFRCYTEAGSEAEAQALLRACLGIMEKWRP